MLEEPSDAPSLTDPETRQLSTKANEFAVTIERKKRKERLHLLVDIPEAFGLRKEPEVCDFP